VGIGSTKRPKEICTVIADLINLSFASAAWPSRQEPFITMTMIHWSYDLCSTPSLVALLLQSSWTTKVFYDNYLGLVPSPRSSAEKFPGEPTEKRPKIALLSLFYGGGQRRKDRK